MVSSIETLAELTDVRNSFPQSAVTMAWKGEGRKVVGWLCTYTPEEIVYAANMLPFRIMGGSVKIEQADAYLYSTNCSFVRSCLELALRNEYDFLDGLVTCNTCDHIRRLFDVWKYSLKTPFIHILSVPFKSSDNTCQYFRTQLLRLKEKIEDFSGENISNKKLQNAIQVYNETRNLLKKLYDLRGKESPPISGAESLSIVIASMITPKDYYNETLTKLLTEITSRESYPEGKARLLISGSELDNPDFIKIIEDLGGLVVTDDLCTGTRYFWDLVDTTVDPLDGLAKRYLDHVSCARMHPVDKRLNHVVEMVKTFNVDGVIYVTLRFCDSYGCDAPLFKEKLQELDIPVLLLDREYELSGVGQIKTRVQAFLETLGG